MEPKHSEIALPPAMAQLPLTPNGYRKPWFVKGKDLRVTNQEKYLKCMEGGICWICGNTNKREQVFVTDVRSALTGISIEPPSHPDCSIYALKVCPFLLMPNFHRRPDTLPSDLKSERSQVVSDINPGYHVLTYVKKFQYGPVLSGNPARFAHWDNKHVLSQSLWKEGRVLTENPSGSLEKTILAEVMTLYR